MLEKDWKLLVNKRKFSNFGHSVENEKFLHVLYFPEFASGDIFDDIIKQKQIIQYSYH